jgi:hypothetical protein
MSVGDEGSPRMPSEWRELALQAGSNVAGKVAAADEERHERLAFKLADDGHDVALSQEDST